MKHIYDNLGIGYTKYRCADTRIVKELIHLLNLSPPATIADIGAGTGNYSRAVADLGFSVLAVEPSVVMRRQALPHSALYWHPGTGERIPLSDGSVDGVFCILASHHFTALEAAVVEMSRICPAGPIVWFTFDPRQAETPWLQDYFPAIWEGTFDIFPPLEDISGLFQKHTCRKATVIPWPIPYDLRDCFMAAGWRRPEMYLDYYVRACMSAFALAEPAAVAEGLARLQNDIETGVWKTTYRHLLDRDAVDWGYRFVCRT